MKRGALVATLLFALALLPHANAAPPACDTSSVCVIEQNSFAYLSPVTLVPSGASIAFASLDTSHITTPGTGQGGGYGCFFEEAGAGETTDAIQLDVIDGALYATSDGRTAPCVDAVDLGGAGFALPYYCFIHPVPRGVLVVTP